ncbi:MAG: hypothetical protein U9M90_03385 [Patescibacteria group bacterium]|nr:hypothetical protein [Patescibacteria group bacterium]
MLNPEKQLYKKVFAKESPLSSSEEAVYRWYLENSYFRKERADRQQLKDMDKFKKIDGYSNEEIEINKQEVLEQRRREHEKDKTQRGEIFETIIGEYGDLNGWFGDMAVAKTTEYDDRINHTDLVLEGEIKNGEKVHIAIDCTVSENLNNLYKKVKRIADEIEDDTLTTIKYFQSAENEEVMGELEYVPRVIIAIQPHRLNELCEQAIKIIDKEKGSNKQFSKSYTQFFLLMQIEAQLQKQKELANLPKKDGSSHPEVIRNSIDTALTKIENIIEEKKGFLDGDTLQEAKDVFEKSGYSSALSGF